MRTHSDSGQNLESSIFLPENASRLLKSLDDEDFFCKINSDVSSDIGCELGKIEERVNREIKLTAV